MEWDFSPARDLNLSFEERLRSHRRERGLIDHAGNAVWLGAVRSFMAAAHFLRVEGREHVPREAPFVVVCNHTSHLDALAVSAALPWRHARQAVALAAGNFFFKSTFSAMFAATALNALPIWREETTRDDLAFLRRRLLEDRMVFILFPEGTRSRSGDMARFRPGLGAFVAGTSIPVLPCFLHGAHACWPPRQKFPRPGRLMLRFGPTLLFDDIENDRAGWLEVAAIAEASVRGLQTF
jgi:1-acyl-sn-glycerol-3-phosphate acyltransferase